MLFIETLSSAMDALLFDLKIVWKLLTGCTGQ